MKTVALGSQGLTVPIEGLGAMGMSAFYSGRDDAESIATLNRAVDLGVTLIDTAEIYGPFTNERLIARALGSRRSEITIASKFAREVSTTELSVRSTAARLTPEKPSTGRCATSEPT